MAGSDGTTRELLANVSHDLRTPLNVIIGFAELLRDGRLGAIDARQHECLAAMHDSARHLLRLIDDVIALSREDGERPVFDPGPVDLPRLIDETRELIRAPLLRRQARLAVECEPGLGALVLDARKLKRVVYDCLATALVLAQDPARVTVRARAAGAERFCIDVETGGPGVAPEALAALLPAGRLATARRIVEAQGGTVAASGTADGGARLAVELPRIPG